MGDFILNKKEEFKEFVKAKPELIDYINKGDMTWQKFYEIYDLYGSDRSIWDKYSGVENLKKETSGGIGKITDMMKGINMDSIQEHIGTAQKALGFVQELTGKNASSVIKPKGPTTPRPIDKFFGD